jgi:hypothetical protein
VVILLSKFETRTGTFKSSRKIRWEHNGNCFHENFGNHRELAGKSWCLLLTNWVQLYLKFYKKNKFKSSISVK